MNQALPRISVSLNGKTVNAVVDKRLSTLKSLIVVEIVPTVDM